MARSKGVLVGSTAVESVVLTSPGQLREAGLRSQQEPTGRRVVGDVSFTAGITFSDDRVVTVDVTSIDGAGLAYSTDDGPSFVPWPEVKAVMLATTDHMLESAGSLFSMAEVVQEADEARIDEAAEMRRFGLRLLQQAAPRLCPLGETCALRPGPVSRP